MHAPCVQIRTDGVLELLSPGSSSASIYAFSADADTSTIGHVFYRESTEAEVLDRFNQLADRGFAGNLTLRSAFIVTWFYVGYFDNHDDLVSTLSLCVHVQLLIVTMHVM